MSVHLSHCLKRFPLVSFPRYYASAAAARSTKTVASDAEAISEHPKVKKRASKQAPKPPPPPTILEWTRVQAHLDELAESNGKLVLDDIERCRPPPPPPSEIDAKVYEEQYTEALNKITKAFTLKQIRQFLKLYGMYLPYQSKKQDCVGAIMEVQWGWRPVKAIEEEQRETHMSSEEFPLTYSEAFLILGKDGADSLTLSNKYHVRLSYLREPLRLKAEGLVGSLKKLAKHISGLKAGITEEIFDLPINKPISTDLLRRVSRLSGALTENFGQSKIRRHEQPGDDRDPPPLFFHLPPSVPTSSPIPESEAFPYAYSLYPFSSPRSLPWTDVDLRAFLQAHHPESPSHSSRVVVASIGHVLLTSSPSNRIEIAPPLQGHLKLPHIQDWIAKRSEPTLFNATLPTALLDSNPARHRMLHRLVYHAINSGDKIVSHKTIKLELVLPRSTTEPAISNHDFGEPQFLPSCWLGEKSDVDVMMPDRQVSEAPLGIESNSVNRPTDIQFSIFDSDLLPAHQWPSNLQEYISNLRAYLSYQDPDALQPETPLTVVHDDVTYVLHSSSTLQQNLEQTEASVKVITESILDLEGEQKSASCQVVCDDLASEASWQSFLRQCDAISTVPPTTEHTMPVL
ncbi:hypothetical protein DFH09DRAFT_1300923 [Mycena vulgaris]|nr:hypothetical protein DFH09DRAFT_1300923 [Mycena vulgaris]